MAPLPPYRERVRDEFDLYVEIFEQTKDKAACWAAFSLARLHGFDIPAEINAEVDRFADAIAAAAFRRFGKFSRANGDADIPLDNEAVGRLWKNSKGREPGTGISTAARSYDLAVAVARHCVLGASKTSAVAKVAKDRSSNKTEVWAALKQHAYVNDMGPDELGLPFPDLPQRGGGS
jgi:hypothetical protein